MAKLRSTQSGIRLNQTRSLKKGFSDLLVYGGFVAPGVLINKNETMTACATFRGPDFQSSTEYERDGLAKSITIAVNALDDGWLVNIDTFRVPAAGYRDSVFPDATSAIFDLSRRQQYEAENTHYVSQYVLTLTRAIPSTAAEAAVGVLIKGGPRGEAPLARLERQVQQFDARVTDAIAAFGAGGLIHVRRMTSDEMLNHLHSCVVGQEAKTPMMATPMFLDSVIGSQDFVGGTSPKIGDRHIRVLALTGLPAYTFPGILEMLNNLPSEFRYSIRYIPMSAADADRVLTKVERVWGGAVYSLVQKMRNTLVNPDTHALGMQTDAIMARGRNSSGDVRFGHFTAAIVFTDEDEARLEETVREAVKQVSRGPGAVGFVFRKEDINAVEAFLGTLPGHGFYNMRRSLLSSENLVDIMPITAAWAGKQTVSCDMYPPNSPPLLVAATSGATPFGLSLHVGDLGHTLVLGPTGAGKSTLLTTMAMQHLRYPGAKVRMFDKGYSAYVPTLACQGAHYDIGGENSNVAFAPFARVSLDNSQEIAWAAEYVAELLALQGMTVTPAHNSVILAAVMQLANADPRYRTMSDFVNSVQDADIRTALMYYTVDNPGAMLDAYEDTVQDGRFVTMELEHLMNRGQKTVAAVLLYLFHALERDMKGEPWLLILDEAWLMLSHPLFRSKIAEWLKVLRKRNVAVVFATQSVSDIMKSEIRDVVLESCPTKILLANPEARNPASAEMYEKLGLNATQLELLSSYMQKKTHYMVISPEGRRVISLGLKPLQLAFVGASTPDDVQKATSLHQTYGEEWVFPWLEYKNLGAWGKYWLSLKREMSSNYPNKAVTFE